MESKKINQLATELAPDLSDLTIIGDPTTGISKKITLSQMASLFTGTVEEYANFAAFPLVGVADTIYIALDTNVIYRWNTGTSAYVELSPNIINSLVFSDANGFDGNISLVGSVATLTITTALTTGSVPFIGASGALSQDNANFFWDNTNKWLGIGTNNPSTPLDVHTTYNVGMSINNTTTNNSLLMFANQNVSKWRLGNVYSSGANYFGIYDITNSLYRFTILNSGEVGIGITNPTTKLHIDGGSSALIANLDANVSVAKSLSFRSDNSNRINLEVSGTESGSNAGANFFIRTYTDAGSLSNGNAFVLKRDTGYIGVGTDTPLTPIHINYQLGTSTSALRLVNGSAANASNISRISLFVANQFGGAEESASIYALNPNALINNGGHLIFATSAYGSATTPTEALRITNERITRLAHRLTYTTFTYEQNLQYSTSPAGLWFGNSFNSNNNVGLSIRTSNDGTGVEAINISSTGNVHLGGVYAPSYILDVSKTTDFDIRIRKQALGGTVGILLETANDFSGTSQAFIKGVGAGSNGTSFLTFGVGLTSGAATGSEIVRLTSNGYIKASNIGSYINTAGNFHEFSNNIGGTVAMFIRSHGSTNGSTILCQTPSADTSEYYFAGEVGGTRRVYIYTNGNIQNTNNSYGQISDISLKKDITQATPKLDDLMKVNIVNFKFINDNADTKQIGVIAQELEQIFPSMIDESEDFEDIEIIDENGGTSIERKSLGTKTKSVKYSVFVPMLIKAMQEQQAQIEELKALIIK